MRPSQDLYVDTRDNLAESIINCTERRYRFSISEERAQHACVCTRVNYVRRDISGMVRHVTEQRWQFAGISEAGKFYERKFDYRREASFAVHTLHIRYLITLRSPFFNPPRNPRVPSLILSLSLSLSQSEARLSLQVRLPKEAVVRASNRNALTTRLSGSITDRNRQQSFPRSRK